eukprot:g7691.t1
MIETTKIEQCVSGTSQNVETTVTNVLRVKRNFKLDVEGDCYYFSDAFVDGTTLWVAAKEKTNGAEFITISRATEEGYIQVKSSEESFTNMFGKQVHLGKNAGIVTPRRTPSRGDITHVLSKLDYENEAIQTTPPINGKLVAWDRATNNFLIWRLQDDQHLLDLYSFKARKCTAPLKIASFELGKRLIDVKCSFLNRKVWPFNEVDEMRDVDSPLVCVVSFTPSASILTTWDTHANKILKQIDVTIDEMQISYDSQIDFSPSPNMNWFALGCSKSKIVALFSFSSEVMVWSTKLELQELGEYNSVFLQFDALSSKLLIFDSNIVRICVPPCLVKDFDLEFKCTNIILERKEEHIVDLRECHAKFMSQNTLLYLSWRRDISFQKFYSMVRVAIPYATSEIAFMFPKEGVFSIIFVSVLDVLSPLIMNLLYESLLKRNVEHSLREIKLYEKENVLESIVSFYFFLYPDKERTTDNIVVFWLYRHRMEVSFVTFVGEPNTSTTFDGFTRELVPFYQRNILFCFQSKDGFRIICLKRYGISVIDLEKRVVIYEVGYRLDLASWLYKFCREKDFKFKRWAIGEDSSSEEEYSTNGSKDSKSQDNDELVEKWVGLMLVFFSPPDVLIDGTALLLGWIHKDNKPLLLTPMTKVRELEEISTQENEIVPCWALDDNFEQFSFLEYDENLNSIKTIGVYHKIGNYQLMVILFDICLFLGEHCKRYGKSDWTLQLTSILKKLNFETLGTLDMKLDNNSGTLWITTLSIATNVKSKLSLLPLGPYAMNDSIPCLHTLDDLADPYSACDLDKLKCQFGVSMFNMPFNGITNLHHAIKHNNMDMTIAILESTHNHNIKLGLRSHQHNCSENKRNFLEEAIDLESEDLVRGVLQLYQEQKIPFNSASFIMKASFPNLWRTNQVQLKVLLTKDLLAWEMCSLDIFSKMLNEHKLGKVLVGTVNDPLTWRQKSNEEAMLDILKLSESRSQQNDTQNIRDTKISVVMKVFCLDDVCKVGTNGIIRFFLTQGAPAYLFKTPLLKWTILWKWEHMWKRNSFWSLIYFLLMLGVFTMYVVYFDLYKDKLIDDLNVQVWLTYILVVLVIITIYMWFQEGKEIKTYKKDSKHLFPNMRFGGIWYYWSSGWNILENITYFLLLFVIAPLHFASFLTTSHIPILSTILAMESILMWFKIWYYAQAFTRTGAFVLMIENVIRDCLPFLMLSGIILVGFSLALFTLFQQSLHQENSNEHDVEEVDCCESTLDKINASFGTPIMAMLTLFYAMIGTFDVEIYSNSGNLSPLIVFVFVLYLSIQAIVMFNMLIAIMSDTFDRVKSTEEEQLLMGRARFIDACEAALSERQIKEME